MVGVGQAPHGAAVDGDNSRLYVANHGDDTLAVVNSVTLRPISTLPVGDGPKGVAYNPANKLIYVTNRTEGTVTVLRASNRELVRTISVGSQPNGVAADGVANRVYVANYGSGTVSVIDGFENRVTATIPVGTEPAQVAVNPLTGKAYVSLHGEGAVAVIDSAGLAARVDIHSAGPYGIAVDTLRNLVYAATIETGRVVAIAGDEDAYLGWAEIRRMPSGELVPLRMIAVNAAIGSSGHLFLTTASSDGGWDRFLLLAKGWPEYFARAHALDLHEPREGLVFDPDTQRAFATSLYDNLLAAYADGAPSCATNFAALAEYQIKVCVAEPDGTCDRILTR
jgi:YVTN family beta-propeller protein